MYFLYSVFLCLVVCICLPCQLCGLAFVHGPLAHAVLHLALRGLTPLLLFVAEVYLLSIK